MEQGQNDAHHAAQKRSRQQLSCTFCRAGKLKCNRQHPCDQCVKRSRDQKCEYLAPPAKRTRNRNTKDRIAHLEGLVVQLMNQGADGETGSANGTSPADIPSAWAVGANQQGQDSVPGSTDSGGTLKDSPGSSTGEQSDAAVAFGQMKISKGETSYVGSAHWEAVLNGVSTILSQSLLLVLFIGAWS